VDRIKAIALFSGGLDSLLAIKLVQEQGIEVEALHLVTAFASRCDPTGRCRLVKIVGAAAALGVSLRIISRDPGLLDLVKSPKQGFGSNMNPCIDCRIEMLKIAAEHMRRAGARFLVTGEVLGQRPMSQRGPTINLIEKETGLRGLVLRPLSAGLLIPTIPEEKGWIDRGKLPSISGRSRKPQMRLAEHYGITDYPSPAGGCLLTDPQFAFRLREMLAATPGLDMNDVQLLKHGRHFRADPGTKVIVGRDENDNARIENLCREGDVLVEPEDIAGPTALLRGNATQVNIRTAASLVARYSKARTKSSMKALVRRGADGDVRTVEVAPAQDAVARELMIVKSHS